MKKSIKEKIHCCRCDKEIKNPETNCYCQECVNKVANWKSINDFEQFAFELYNKSKSKKRIEFEKEE